MPILANRSALGLLAALIAAGVFLAHSRSADAGSKSKSPVFEKDVLPIFQAKCLHCHGDKKRKAGLDLRTLSAMLQGGETGPALKPSSFKDNLLWDKIASDKMPPGKNKLSPAEKEVVKRWIETGAHADGKVPAAGLPEVSEVTDADRDFWAFRKPIRPTIPPVPKGENVRNPIDAFILTELQRKGLTWSKEAERTALLRRVTFDLTGLPPSARDIDAFLADKSADAYERVVERLLASSSYGERWGRHWLDLAGYADSEGILDADYVRSAAWRYRDYVIRAFNSDKPYDRFLQEQLAGDELVDYWRVYESQKELSPPVLDAVIATGFLRCASDTSRPDFANIKNAKGYYFQTLDDTVKIVASATLGLTVQCARCHSHKYDPIPQTEYYRLQAIFMSGYRPSQWIPQVQRKLMDATMAQEKEAKEHNAKLNSAISALKKQLQEKQAGFADKLFEQRLAKLPEAVRQQVRAALTLAPAQRNAMQKKQAAMHQAALKPVGPALEKALSDAFADYRKLSQDVAKNIQAEERQRRVFQEIRAFYDLPGEVKTHLLRRGDYLTPGRVVTPGALTVLATARPFTWSAPPPPREKGKSVKTSGRRLAFARWLTQPDHPLTARVLVNRLWTHHFGQGIVATPDNFGRTGSPPSHPRLLDWLASEFTQPTTPATTAEKPAAWSIKHMHRLIVTSRTYRQASRLDPVGHVLARKVDPENRLLWRQRLRRLEAEALRDAVLFVAGNLNPQMFGPPVPMQRHGDGQVVVSADASGTRRSVYLQVRRSQPLTFLQLFDQPVIETNCTRRETSTVASQALTLLNSDFMVRQADLFAVRLLKESPKSAARNATLLAFGRPPTERELGLFEGFLATQAQRHARATPAQQAEARRRALADLCQMLLSANEFAYVD